jgi:hypothetical protein
VCVTKYALLDWKVKCFDLVFNYVPSLCRGICYKLLQVLGFNTARCGLLCALCWREQMWPIMRTIIWLHLWLPALQFIGIVNQEIDAVDVKVYYICKRAYTVKIFKRFWTWFLLISSQPHLLRMVYIEEWGILRCGAVWVDYKPTFRKNLSPPYNASEEKCYTNRLLQLGRYNFGGWEEVVLEGTR